MLCLPILVAAIASTVSAQSVPPVTEYLVGPQDVLTITSFDQADLTGKFVVDADGTFSFPMIGRFKAGGLTLRQVEQNLEKQLKDEGFFKNPQLTVSVETYRSQKVFVMGEVRTPGPYVLSGAMSLVEVIARAGSTLPTASGEAVIVRGDPAAGPASPSALDGAVASGNDNPNIVRVNLRDLENGVFSQNAALRDGDTIFVTKAELIYVSGQVKNPNAYALQNRNTTVLQALALAGGVTDRGSLSRIVIVRTINGEKKEIKAKVTDTVQPGDTIIVKDRFF